MATMTASDRIVTECINYMKNNDIGRVCEWNLIASEYCLSDLKNHCEQTFIHEFESIFNRISEIESCSNEMLYGILSLELKCAESDVFEGCVKWARAKSENTSDGAILRTTLGKCMEKIRFCSMSVDQFVGVLKNYPKLITAEEAIKIVMEISTQNEKLEDLELDSGYYAVKQILDKRVRDGKVS